MRKIFAAVALIALAACSDNVTDPYTGSIAGSYNLQTVNGSRLPYTFPGSTSTSGEVVTSDVITMYDNGTWTEAYTSTITTNGSSSTGTDNSSGTYSRNGANIVLVSGSQTAYVGTFDGRSLLLSSNNFTLVFTR